MDLDDFLAKLSKENGTAFEPKRKEKTSWLLIVYLYAPLILILLFSDTLKKFSHEQLTMLALGYIAMLLIGPAIYIFVGKALKNIRKKKS